VHKLGRPDFTALRITSAVAGQSTFIVNIMLNNCFLPLPGPELRLLLFLEGLERPEKIRSRLKRLSTSGKK
jgi:hypothetical protein